LSTQSFQEAREVPKFNDCVFALAVQFVSPSERLQTQHT
jgi:hypothetical protein